GQRFAGVVVTNYLYRPHLPALIESVAPDGVLIYETFARGNERFGRPSNPDHLLEAGELLEAVRGSLRILAYEDLDVERPKPAAVQRICALREDPGRS
ncbi:MAG: SAM-dependent methyltransferase, partial [Rhodospirillales bacterium]|nr:SAM-dependent methyltransferase [Rhodospirillales bacterium]